MLCVPRNADTFEAKGTLWGAITDDKMLFKLALLRDGVPPVLG